jgi:type II secretory pathway component PulC
VAGLFKYKVFNFILFAVVLSTAFMNYETWSHSNGSGKGVAQRPEVRLENQNKTATLAVKEEPESVQSFRIIAEKNIFNPEREDFSPPGLLSTEQPKPIVRPQVILSGVIISDNYQAASVSSPGRPLRKGEREAMKLELGDKIGEYKLAKIAADRIIMEAGGDSFEVLLYDSKKPKTRVEVKTAIQSINEAKTAQPAPAVDIAKAEVMGKPVEPTKEIAMTPASPSARKEVPASAVRWGMAMRQSLTASNQQNTGIVENTTENRDKSSGLEKTKPQ